MTYTPDDEVTRYLPNVRVSGRLGTESDIQINLVLTACPANWIKKNHQHLRPDNLYPPKIIEIIYRGQASLKP